jgi:branched-chain amino acid transport system ATP-binding protein
VLRIDNLECVYQDVILAISGVSIVVGDGAFVALLGTNGAGKTTVLRCILGLLKSFDGAITKGGVHFNEERINGLSTAAIVERGIALVPEGRRVFQDLTVAENLRMGAFARRDDGAREADQAWVLELFPRLKERWRQQAGYLSGGEQQMLAIGRGLMARPKLLLLDEPSLGLAPLAVSEIFGIIHRVNVERGTSVLLVEQNAVQALRLARYGYILETGKIVLDGPSESLLANEDVQEFYLGVVGEQHRSYRDLKTYRRRKRWFA